MGSDQRVCHWLTSPFSGPVCESSLQNYDNGDSQLDSTEFLKFVQHNETAVNVTSYNNEENNRLLRSDTQAHKYS